MKIIAFNGSPRKKWNTATLLRKALEGASSRGAETELVHLYDLEFKGCVSCFACKTKNGTSYGRCAVKDDLAPVLDAVRSVDAVLLGSPVYLGSVSGEMRSFMERLIFPYIAYTNPYRSLFPKKVKTGFIYTMGATEETMNKLGFAHCLNFNESIFQRVFESFEALFSFDTYQFDDYSKIVCDFDVEKKTKRRKEVFPIDCQKAFDLGVRLAS